MVVTLNGRRTPNDVDVPVYSNGDVFFPATLPVRDQVQKAACMNQGDVAEVHDAPGISRRT